MKTILTTARTLRRLTAVVAGLLVMLAVLAPGAARADDGAAASAAAAGVPPGKAWVRVGHFVPGMGATSIDVTPLDGSAAPITLAGGATYGQVSAYRKLAPGSYTVSVRMSSASSGSAPMLSRSLEVAPDQARTVAVLGTSTAPRLAVLTDDLTPPAPGSARVRVLTAAPGVDATTVSAVDGPTIARDAVLGQATAYTSVPAGSWTLQLRGGSDTVDASLQSVPIAGGSVYTIVVLDAGATPGAEPGRVRLDVVTDAAGAVTAPKGGAKTGLGGMAPGAQSAAPAGGVTTPPLSVAVALLAALAIGTMTTAVRGRRRSRGR